MIIFFSIIFTTILVVGITIFTQDGMGGYFFRRKAVEADNKLMEVIVLCEWCMPSLWSLAGYSFSFLLCGWELKALLFYPITICASSILSGGIWGLLKIIINKNSPTKN